MPQARSSLVEVNPGYMGAQTTGGQMMEAEPPSATPTGLCSQWRPRSQMTEAAATHHPSAPVPPSSHPALTYCWPCSEVDSNHFLSVQGMLCEDQKKPLHHLKHAWLDINSHCLPWPGIHCLGGSCLSGTICILLTPSYKLFEESGSWVGLGPAP